MTQFFVIVGLAALLLLLAMAGMAINLFFKRKTRIRSCRSSQCGCATDASSRSSVC